MTATPVLSPPRFREVGVAIGDAVDVRADQPVTFPLALSFGYDPREPQVKGVPPELIQAFFFDERTGTWSTEGLEVTGINVTDGVVSFETTHLTVFRLGVPRGRPPTLHQARPQAVGPDGSFGLWGRGFSLPAAQNVLTIGGSYVGLVLDAAGHPQPFAFNDEGETLTLRDAQDLQLDQAPLQAPPVGRASWTRQADGDEQSPFVLHTDAALGRLFSPGTRANGDAFVVSRGNVSQPPAPGELVINEVLLVPPNSFLGDANGDGETNPDEDVFVELVNTTEHPLELGGCRLLTQNSGERHRFPAGTILPGGMAFVLFGVDDPALPPQPAGPFGGERVFPDLSGEKRLIARAPSDVSPGTDFVQATTFRQTSNPMTFQFLTPLGERLPAFDHQSQALGPIAQLPLRMLRLGDLDRDLDLDLTALTGSADVVLGLNDGFGEFVQGGGRLTLPAGRRRFFDMALADLTEDGAPELILGDTDQSGSYTQLFVYHNNGGGYFQLESQQGVLNSPASSGPSALAPGDVDDDGDLDIVIAMIGDQSIFFRNDGSSHFSHLPGLDVLPQSQVVVPTDLALADVDSDGDLDVLLSAGRAGLGGFSDVQLFINQGGGQFSEGTASRLPVRSEGIESLAIGDVDGDSALDIAASGLLTAPRLYHNNGSGIFTLADASAFASARAATVLLEDLDGDRDLDLVFSQSPRDLVYLNDGTGVFFALAPLPEVPGAHVEVVASDVDNDGDLDLLGVGSLTLLLNTGTRANHPPTIDAIADQPVIEGDPLIVNVIAHDIDDDSLTLEASLASGQPLSTIGASFTDHGAGQGTVNWTPGFDQGLLGGKLYEVVVKAHDGLATVSRTIRIFVHNFNHAPSLAPIDPQTVDELEPMSIQLSAQDEDLGDVLTFGSVNQPSGSTLNSSSGLFQWTPGPIQGNDPQGFLDYPVTFTVTDLAHATDEEDVTIRVLHRNHAPIFTPVGSKTVAEGQLLQFVLAASDPDGDPVTVSDVEVPDGAAFDDATRTFRWTPDFTQARVDPYLARFIATDQEFSTPFDVWITVLDTHVNQPPVLGALSDQTVLEGHLLQFAFPVSDADGDPLTVAVMPLPRGARVFQQGAVWLFQWVPGMDQSGVYPMAIEVTDGLVTSPTMGDVTVNVIENPGFQRLVAQVGFMTDGGDAALHDAFHAQQAQEGTSFHAAQEAEETAFRAAADAAHLVFSAGLASMHAAEHTDLDELRQELLSELLTGDPATDAVVRAFVDQFITAAHDQGIHAALEALHTFGHSDDHALDAEFHAVIDAIHQTFHDDIASGAIADELHAFVHTSTSPVIDSAVHAALDGAVDAYHNGGIHAATAVLDAAVDAALAVAHETFQAQQQAAHDAAHAEQAAA
ncbi:MAG: FG-GAP-like repeat-containing protein, partial [Candidatus Omnitrophota bacterium]|nr:FG-GAP-like repeat-containing protein [Candidatus Omnitrophota bacterium]